MKDRLTDNSAQFAAKLRENAKRTLVAIGIESVKNIMDGMDTLYGKPIWDTGDLHRSISYEVEQSGENTVDIGTEIEYGKFVHEGTYKIAGRPFIRDSMLGDFAQDRLKEVIAAYMRKGI